MDSATGARGDAEWSGVAEWSGLAEWSGVAAQGDPGGAGWAPLDPAVLDGVLQSLLDSHPGALLFALDSAAARVPLPDDPRFGGRTVLPGGWATCVDYVVPADRLAVVGCWERARAIGLGVGHVRLACWPERVMVYTLVDCRERHGAWIGLLTAADDADGEDAGLVEPVRDPAKLVPTTPRTGLLHKNLWGVITASDERTSRMLGWSEREMVGRRSLEFIHPDDHERAVAQWLEMRARRRSQRVRVRHVRRDGTWIWVEVDNEYVGLDDPDRLVAIAHLTDITDEMGAWEAVRRQEALFRQLAESLPVGVVQLGPDRGIVYANARVRTLLGAGATGRLDEHLDRVVPGDRGALERAVADALAGRRDTEVEVAVAHGGPGTPRRCLCSVAAVCAQDGSAGAIVTVTDVTEAARLRDRLREQATRDHLTGLLNRAAVLDGLAEAVRGPAAEHVAVVFLDLDGFKDINDRHGHGTGDAVLVHVAGLLSVHAREADLVGRLGGDEFLVVRTGVRDADDADELARELRGRLRTTLTLPVVRIRVEASVGVARAWPGATVPALVAAADRAMYLVKRASR